MDPTSPRAPVAAFTPRIYTRPPGAFTPVRPAAVMPTSPRMATPRDGQPVRDEFWPDDTDPMPLLAVRPRDAAAGARTHPSLAFASPRPLITPTGLLQPPPCGAALPDAVLPPPPLVSNMQFAVMMTMIQNVQTQLTQQIQQQALEADRRLGQHAELFDKLFSRQSGESPPVGDNPQHPRTSDAAMNRANLAELPLLRATPVPRPTAAARQPPPPPLAMSPPTPDLLSPGSSRGATAGTFYDAPPPTMKPYRPTLKKDLPTFSGKAEDLQGWLGQFETACVYHNIAERDRPFALSQHISSVTAHRLGLNGPETLPLTYAAFKKRLLRLYFGPDQTNQYCEEVYRAVQAADETVEMFAARIQLAATLANQEELRILPHTEIQQFIAGLRDRHIKTYVEAHRLKDLARATRGIPVTRSTLEDYAELARYITPKHPPATAAAVATVASVPSVPPAMDPAQLQWIMAAVNAATVSVDAAHKSSAGPAKKRSPQPRDKDESSTSKREDAKSPSSNDARSRCFNCNRLGHRTRQCEEPFDKARTARNAQAWRDDAAKRRDAEIAQHVQAAIANLQASSAPGMSAASMNATAGGKPSLK
jgi:hypothetical protein